MKKTDVADASRWSRNNKIHPDADADLNDLAKSIFIKVSSSRVIHVKHFLLGAKLNQSAETPEEIDDGESVVLFLLHGVGGSIQSWSKQIEFFLELGYEIVAFDLLGHGQSSKPRDSQAYDFSSLANDCLHIFDLFGKKKNVLIGHSYGSSFCTLVARQRTRIVSKVVLISGGGPTTLAPDSCSAFCLPMPLFFCIRPALVRSFRRLAFHANTDPEVRNQVSTFGIPSHALKAIMQGQNWYEADEDYHAQLMVPVLLIHGKGDRFVSLEDEMWMNETIYGSKLEIVENAGHMVMIEAPDEVNSIIRDFLNRDASTRSVGSIAVTTFDYGEPIQSPMVSPVHPTSVAATEPDDGSACGWPAFGSAMARPDSVLSGNMELRRQNQGSSLSKLGSQASLRGSKFRRKTMF